MLALTVWTQGDGLLSVVAPLGLGASAGTALVVDLDPDGPQYPATGSLADLVANGPRRRDLTPTRRGLAVLPNGGVCVDDAADVVQALMAGWPAVVLRVSSDEATDRFAPVVPVRPLLPGFLASKGEAPAVFQDFGFGVAAPGPGPVLPRLRPSFLKGMLEGVVGSGSRWVRAWRRVWSRPWP
jgi:hypothetical protein